MKAYTYQIGSGSGDAMTKVVFSQELLADSLAEAIDKAKAVTRARSAQGDETTIHLLDEADGERKPVWARSVEDVRTAE